MKFLTNISTVDISQWYDSLPGWQVGLFMGLIYLALVTVSALLEN